MLSYLEWVRLIGTGGIRLDEQRIVRWRPDLADPLQVVADLMLGAPDLGTSATGFVLAMLEPEVLDRIREGGIYLGKRLNLDAVKSFHSFGDTALAVHRHDAEAAGVEIDLTPLSEGWAPWVAAVESADRRARGEALLAMFEVPPCDRFGEATEWLADRERCIVPDDIVRARDSMFFGWACVLNSQKVRTGVAPSLPADAKDEVDAIRRDFDVDQPFLARAPRLRAFVASLAAEGERPTDLLAMASLKQHERYVIKREGAALDLASLFDDIRILEGLDAGAAGFLVRTLGERVPGELIRALKVRNVTRPVAPEGVCTSVDVDEARAPDNVESEKFAPTINEAPPPQPMTATTSPESPMSPEIASVNSAGGAVVAASVVSDQAPTIIRGEALAEPLKEVEVALDSADHPQSLSTPDQLGLDLDHTPMKAEAVRSPEAATDPGPKDGKQTEVAAKTTPMASKRASAVSEAGPETETLSGASDRADENADAARSTQEKKSSSAQQSASDTTAEPGISRPLPPMEPEPPVGTNSVQQTASNATSPETQAGTQVPVAHPMEEEPSASPTEAPAADAQEPSANTEPAATSRRSRKRTPSKAPAKARQSKSAMTKSKPSAGADP